MHCLLTCFSSRLYHIYYSPHATRCSNVPGWETCSTNIGTCVPAQFPQVQAFARQQLAATHYNETSMAVHALYPSASSAHAGYRYSAGVAGDGRVIISAPVSHTLSSTAPLTLPRGSGAYLHTCQSHCEAVKKDYNGVTVDGTTMVNAVEQWWNTLRAPRQLHTLRSSGVPHVYLPCAFTTTSPYQCNPTCPQPAP